MTGRKGRVISGEAGEVQYEMRHEDDVPLELLNIAEKERFMAGDKVIPLASKFNAKPFSLGLMNCF